MPETHVVCRAALKPFCIGHWLHLVAGDSSFVTGARRTLGDLYFAVLVCSQSYEDFAGSLARLDIERAMLQWHNRLSGGFSGRLRRAWKRQRGIVVTPGDVLGFDFAAECAAFERYLNAHIGDILTGDRPNEWCAPKRWKSGDDSTDQPGSPYFVALLDCATNELGLTQGEALNAPIPWLRWRWAVYSERHGQTRIVTDEALAEARRDQELANEFARKVESGAVVLE